MSTDSDFFKHMGNAVGIVGKRDEIGSFFDRFGSVVHGDSQTCIPYHRDIVETVTAGDTFLSVITDMFQQSVQSRSLVNAVRHDLQKIRLRTEYAQFVFIFFGKNIFQTFGSPCKRHL